MTISRSIPVPSLARKSFYCENIVSIQGHTCMVHWPWERQGISFVHCFTSIEFMRYVYNMIQTEVVLMLKIFILLSVSHMDNRSKHDPLQMNRFKLFHKGACATLEVSISLGRFLISRAIIVRIIR